jgi:hypothetical protein
VPSTGRRTAVTGTLTFLPVLIAAIARGRKQELPPAACVTGDAIISVVILLARLARA